MINHPDDPALGYDFDDEKDAASIAYDTTEAVVNQAARDFISAMRAAVRPAAILERAGVGVPDYDILADEFLAMLSIEPDYVAADVAERAAERLDTTFADDLEDAGHIAEMEAHKIMQLRN